MAQKLTFFNLWR